MAVPVSPARGHRSPAQPSRSHRLGPRARLVGALSGMVVLVAGCGTAAGADAAAVSGPSATPSATTALWPVCSCGPTAAAAALASAHVGVLDVSAGYAITSVRSVDGTTTAAYMSIANAGLRPAGLVGASSTMATSVELDTTAAAGSIADTAVTSIPIVAGGTVALAPGGYHLTVKGLSAPLQIGDTLALTLHFSGGRTAHVTLPVEAR
jgi:copper(I)-binding protein